VTTDSLRDRLTVTGHVSRRGRNPEGVCGRSVRVEPCHEQRDEDVTEESGVEADGVTTVTPAA
jgi:hypothetical protein